MLFGRLSAAQQTPGVSRAEESKSVPLGSVLLSLVAARPSDPVTPRRTRVNGRAQAPARTSRLTALMHYFGDGYFNLLCIAELLSHFTNIFIEIVSSIF